MGYLEEQYLMCTHSGDSKNCLWFAAYVPAHCTKQILSEISMLEHRLWESHGEVNACLTNCSVICDSDDSEVTFLEVRTSLYNEILCACKRASWWLSGKGSALPMQETRVLSLIQKGYASEWLNPCSRAPETSFWVHGPHNYWSSRA